MARYIPAERRGRDGIAVPLSMLDLQMYVEGFAQFIELLSGDYLIVNEEGHKFAPLNPMATSIAGMPIYGDAVLCTPDEIE